MRERVHALGQRYRLADLIQHATGTPPGAADYVAYLTQKHTALYAL